MGLGVVIGLFWVFLVFIFGLLFLDFCWIGRDICRFIGFEGYGVKVKF